METPKTTCSECGANVPGGTVCRDWFDRCLAVEFSDPAYFAVHFLSVPAYLLQHPSQLSGDGWDAMYQILTNSVREETPYLNTNTDARRAMQSDERAFRFTGGEPKVLPATLRWTRTIADVRFTNAEEYGGDVWEWARSVVADVEASKCVSAAKRLVCGV